MAASQLNVVQYVYNEFPGAPDGIISPEFRFMFALCSLHCISWRVYGDDTGAGGVKSGAQQRPSGLPLRGRISLVHPRRAPV